MFLFCAALAGCSFAPDYKRPDMDMPRAWPQELTAPVPPEESEALSVQWWKRFNDPVLNALIDEAFLNNRDLAAALARVDYAKAQLGYAQGEQFPLFSASAEAQPTYLDNQKVTSSLPYRGTLAASWALDLWGKYRNLTAAARAQFLASEAAYEGTRLTLAGEVANAYFQLRTLDLQLGTAERTLKTREVALTINNTRYEQGFISELDLIQAQSVVETARTKLYQTRASIEAAEGALAAMLGRSPREIMQSVIKRGHTLEELPAPPVIPEGLPSTLLERRPDIRQAEQAILAATANVGVARAAWFPDISLTGALGVVSLQLADLFRSHENMKMHSFSGTASVPLLDFGRVYNNMKAADASLREEYAVFEQTVLNAFSDVRTALAAQRESDNIVESLSRQVAQYRTAYELATLRYENGYSAYLDVLDAERSLFQSELDLATARGNRLSSVVSVCLALGGGWNDTQPSHAPTAQGRQ